MPRYSAEACNPPPRACRVVTAQVVSVIDLLTPEADHTLQVADRVNSGRLKELRLGAFERRRVGLASGRQHLDGRHRDLSVLERRELPWHVPERTSDAQFRPRVPPGDLVR
jgi:hypothetical protein